MAIAECATYAMEDAARSCDLVAGHWIGVRMEDDPCPGWRHGAERALCESTVDQRPRIEPGPAAAVRPESARTSRCAPRPPRVRGSVREVRQRLVQSAAGHDPRGRCALLPRQGDFGAEAALEGALRRRL